MTDLRCGDCIEHLKTIKSGSIDLVLTDPPYNIGIASWDKIDDYINWCMIWLKECQRVLKPNGVLYFWHNDIQRIAELLHEIRKETSLKYVSFCIWNKGDSYRALSWYNRNPQGRTALRSWFNICEFCLHFFNSNCEAQKYDDGGCYAPLIEWYEQEKKRLGITNKDITRSYVQKTGRTAAMLKHYFKRTQFALPTREVWESVYTPLGFCPPDGYDGMKREYKQLREACEALRHAYMQSRNTHHVDPMHCNVWNIPPISSNNRLHTCQKPVPLLERLIKVSSNEGATVLDCFMGSGSTGVACVNTGRDFIGIERDTHYFDVASKRIQQAGAEGRE